MKKLFISLLAIGMIVGSTINVTAQATATASGDALATIIAPITITAGVDLSFGDIIKGLGTVAVATDGSRTIGATMLAGSQLGTITAATFVVTGEEGYTYNISLPDDVTAELTLLTADPMTVTDFVSSPATSSTLTAGDNTILVGATLNVAETQLAGDYTGSFDVTVNYN